MAERDPFEHGMAVETCTREEQHTKPCGDCPWRRKALPGWLGTMTADEWVQAAHGEALVDCHQIINQQCAGIAIYRANVVKTPRDRNILRLPADRERVFARPDEFKEHHQRKGNHDGSRTDHRKHLGNVQRAVRPSKRK